MCGKQKFRVVKTTIKTGCDLERELIMGNLSKGKAEALKATMDARESMGDFDPNNITSYLVEPSA